MVDITKPLDERINELAKQVKTSIAQVSTYEEILEAINDGSTHIIAKPNTYLVQEEIIIPKEVSLDLRGGEFLFNPGTGITLYGTMQDRTDHVLFDGIKKVWNNIIVLEARLILTTPYFKMAQAGIQF